MTKDSAKSDHSDHLIELAINQSSNVQAWTKFLVAVQGGLGVGYVLLFTKTEIKDPNIIQVIGWTISLVGIFTCLAISIIIVRQQRWSAWFIKAYLTLPDNEKVVGIVYPDDGRPLPPDVSSMRPGFVSAVITFLCLGMCILWLLAMHFANLWTAEMKRQLKSECRQPPHVTGTC